jgi:hypothetical protein
MIIISQAPSVSNFETMSFNKINLMQQKEHDLSKKTMIFKMIRFDRYGNAKLFYDT